VLVGAIGMLGRAGGDAIQGLRWLVLLKVSAGRVIPGRERGKPLREDAVDPVGADSRARARRSLIRYPIRDLSVCELRSPNPGIFAVCGVLLR